MKTLKAMTTPWHTQNGREPRVFCGIQKRKRPTENSWALNGGGAEATGFELALQTPE